MPPPSRSPLRSKLKRETMTLRDLSELKPDVARSMRMLLDYDGADLEDVFCLNFTVTYESWGERKTHDLIKDGSTVPVTAENRKVRVGISHRRLPPTLSRL